MKISFIITSIGKAKELQNCIASIEKAYESEKDIFEIEIIVVVQNVKEEISIKTKYPAISIFHYINETGLSRLRNYAIRRSKGEFLIFIDDDAAIKENFLKILAENISKYEINAYCGRILDPTKNQYFSQCFLNNSNRYLNRLNFKYFMGSSHILSKNIIEKIGFYDNNFGAGACYGGAEESDVFFRLLQQNESVLYVPELVFYHPISHKNPPAKVFSYSCAVGAMLTKQIMLDRKHVFQYLFLLTEILVKSLIRAIQNKLFPKSIASKNEQFQFSSVFRGTVKGIASYINRSVYKMKINVNEGGLRNEQNNIRNS